MVTKAGKFIHTVVKLNRYIAALHRFSHLHLVACDKIMSSATNIGLSLFLDTWLVLLLCVQNFLSPGFCPISLQKNFKVNNVHSNDAVNVM